MNTEMNTDLRHALTERAARAGGAPLDLGQVMTRGSRLRRRRRATGVLAVGLSVAAVATSSVLLTQLGQDHGPAPAASESTPPIVWARGAEIHVDGATVRSAAPVVTLIQSGHGIVWSDAHRAVWSMEFDSPRPDRQPERVGTVAENREQLRTDGDVVAWIGTGTSGAGGAEVVTLEHGSTSPAAGTGFGSAEDRLVAVDGGQFYLHRGGQLVRTVSSEQDGEHSAHSVTYEPLGEWEEETSVPAVVNGQVLSVARPDDADPVGRVGPNLTTGPTFNLWMALALSTDASLVVGESEPDRGAVVDVATGAVRPLAPEGYAFSVGYRWIDADTFLALAVPGDPSKELDSAASTAVLQCDAPVGAATVTCREVLSDIGTLDDAFVVPFGDPMDG